MRLAVGLWHDADAFVIVVFAREGKSLLGPGALDDLEHLGEALSALAVGNAVSFIGTREAAAADAKH